MSSDEAFANRYVEWSAVMTADIAFYIELAREADGPLSVELAREADGPLSVELAREADGPLVERR